MSKLEIEKIKAQLNNFFGGQYVTFDVKTFDDGDWIAQCHQIAGLSTAGGREDYQNIDSLIKEAIVCAVGINDKYIDRIKFLGLKPIEREADISSNNEPDVLNTVPVVTLQYSNHDLQSC